jgi:diadenosine tetraphosphate (Ap4A) HIT family hydrolase
VKRVTGVEQYNVLENNGPLAHQAVFHVHFHIIPKPNEEEGLGVRWRSGKLADAEGGVLARELREALAS